MFCIQCDLFHFIFQKTFITSSPPKLELDDEEIEADFELTPSMITQVKNVAVPINLSNTQNIQNKNTFLSKPLIQSSGNFLKMFFER